MKKWILVPIITEKEAEDEFLEKVKDSGKIVLIYVVDSEKMNQLPAGFIGSGIKSAENVMQEIKEKLPEVEIKECIEWGRWLDKIENTAKLEKTDEVVMRKSAFTDELKGELEKRGVKVVIF